MLMLQQGAPPQQLAVYPAHCGHQHPLYALPHIKPPADSPLSARHLQKAAAAANWDFTEHPASPFAAAGAAADGSPTAAGSPLSLSQKRELLRNYPGRAAGRRTHSQEEGAGGGGLRGVVSEMDGEDPERGQRISAVRSLVQQVVASALLSTEGFTPPAAMAAMAAAAAAAAVAAEAGEQPAAAGAPADGLSHPLLRRTRSGGGSQVLRRTMSGGGNSGSLEDRPLWLPPGHPHDLLAQPAPPVPGSLLRTSSTASNSATPAITVLSTSQRRVSGAKLPPLKPTVPSSAAAAPAAAAKPSAAARPSPPPDGAPLRRTSSGGALRAKGTSPAASPAPSTAAASRAGSDAGDGAVRSLPTMLRVRVPSNARERLEADAAAVMAQLARQQVQADAAAWREVERQEQAQEQERARQQQQEQQAEQQEAYDSYTHGDCGQQEDSRQEEEEQGQAGFNDGTFSEWPHTGLPPALQAMADLQERRLKEHEAAQLAQAAAKSQRKREEEERERQEADAASPTIQAYYASQPEQGWVCQAAAVSACQLRQLCRLLIVPSRLPAHAKWLRPPIPLTPPPPHPPPTCPPAYLPTCLPHPIPPPSTPSPACSPAYLLAERPQRSAAPYPPSTTHGSHHHHHQACF
jgi:hypothetical protein